MHKGPRVSISSGARGVRRRCRRRRSRGRDSSGARIRSNRKFYPHPGYRQRAALRTRLAVEQVDSPSRTKRRTSASKRGASARLALPQVRKGQRGDGWSDAAAKAGGSGGATTSVSYSGGGSGRRGGRRRRRRRRFRTPHLAMVRTEVGRANPTRHPGIWTGTTHKVHRAGPAVPRARSRAIFSLATLRNERKSFPSLSRHVVIVPLPVPSASHRIALPDSLRKLGCMRNALCIFAKAQEWNLTIKMQIFCSRIPWCFFS